MQQNAHGLSARAEFFLVVVGAFGYFVLGSVASLFVADTGSAISQDHLRFLLAYETIVLALIGGFLYLRGWTLDRLGFIPNLKDTGVGILVAAVTYLAYFIAWTIASNSVSELQQQANRLVQPNLGLVTVVAVSLLNPVFEEIFVCGYVITALKKTRSITFAINVSIGIRLAYHLYQGTVGVVSIIPVGIVFSYWFARTGRLWPVVVAHALFDLAALIGYVRF